MSCRVDLAESRALPYEAVRNPSMTIHPSAVISGPSSRLSVMVCHPEPNRRAPLRPPTPPYRTPSQ